MSYRCKKPCLLCVILHLLKSIRQQLFVIKIKGTRQRTTKPSAAGKSPTSHRPLTPGPKALIETESETETVTATESETEKEIETETASKGGIKTKRKRNTREGQDHGQGRGLDRRPATLSLVPTDDPVDPGKEMQTHIYSPSQNHVPQFKFFIIRCVPLMRISNLRLDGKEGQQTLRTGIKG